MSDPRQPTRFRDLPRDTRTFIIVALVAILAPLAVYLYMRDQHQDALACEQPIAELYRAAYNWESNWRRFQDHNTRDEDREELWRGVSRAYNGAAFAWYDIEQACTRGHQMRRPASAVWELMQYQLEPRREACAAILRWPCDKPTSAL